MTFQELKEDKLNQIRELIRVESDDILTLNSVRCLALIFLADYYQVYYAFKYRKWDNCAMHSIASNLAKFEPIFMNRRNVALVESLEMIMADRCSYAHGDVELRDVEIDVDEINRFADILDNLIVRQIYNTEIWLDIQAYANSRRN